MSLHAAGWMPGPAAPRIANNEVHVWRLSLRGAVVSEETLSPGERDRAAQVTGPGARHAFIATRAALRALISRYEGVDVTTLEFTTGPHGKPRLATRDSALEFNVSHSGDWAVIAISRGIPVGIDVEQVRPHRAKPELAKRFFSPPEKAVLHGADDKTGARFFELWARKEAYLKAIGTGLATGFSKIDATANGLPDLLPNGEPVSPSPVWFASPFAVDDSHPGCVVARSPNFSLTLHNFDRLAL